jgi:predicted dehydrogenase
MVALREHRFPFLDKVGDWNRFNRNTGGTLVEKTCHYFDLMIHITEATPIRVFASGGQSVNHLAESYGGEAPDILDNAFVIVDFDSGARGLLDLNMFADATYNQEELSVVGDQGKVESLIPQNVLRVGRRGEHFIGEVAERAIADDSIGHVGFHHGASFVEHSKLRDAIRNQTEPEVDVNDGLWSVAVGAAAHLSIDLGRPVELTELLTRSETC